MIILYLLLLNLLLVAIVYYYTESLPFKDILSKKWKLKSRTPFCAEFSNGNDTLLVYKDIFILNNQYSLHTKFPWSIFLYYKIYKLRKKFAISDFPNVPVYHSIFNNKNEDVIDFAQFISTKNDSNTDNYTATYMLCEYYNQDIEELLKEGQIIIDYLKEFDGREF